MSPCHTCRFVVLASLATLLVASGCGDHQPPGQITGVSAAMAPWSGDPEFAQTLAAIRAATAQFHDVGVALAAGYRQGSPCEFRPAGGMGHHYPNGSLMGIIPGTSPVRGIDAVIDPLQPEVLLYEPTANGGRRLVGVEYLVFAAAWDAVHADPPLLGGVIPFDYMAGADAHGFEPHYELHVWLWRHNPQGMFTKWNPKVSCQ